MNKKAPIAPIAIIGAMSQEVETLVENLENRATLTLEKVEMHSGTLDGVPVIVTQSGIGKVNATIATTLVIERFSPRAVINTGSAGGIGDGLSVGDVVIGESVAHHDVDVTGFGYKIGQVAQMPEDYHADANLMEKAEKSAEAFLFLNSKIHRGQIVSGDQFVAGEERFANIKKNFPNALAVEMEAASIAQTCFRLDVPCVIIRAISDLANEEANVSFEEFIEQASKHSAEMVTAMVADV